MPKSGPHFTLDKMNHLNFKIIGILIFYLLIFLINKIYLKKSFDIVVETLSNFF
jgi:hypothetical protein